MSAYYDDGMEGDDYNGPAGSLEQDLVDALDLRVQQSVNKALVRAIEPLKTHLFGYTEQQGWLPPFAPQVVLARWFLLLLVAPPRGASCFRLCQAVGVAGARS